MEKSAKSWEMNETQKEFVKILGENPDGITLYDIESRYGKKFATGSINVLKSKGITATEEVAIACNIVRADNGQVVGKTTKKVSLYKLAQ